MTTTTKWPSPRRWPADDDEQTIEKLRALRLSGLAEAYRRQTRKPGATALSFDERLGLLVDQHCTWRENKAMPQRLKTSKLETEPCAEDINYRYARQLDGAKLRSLLSRLAMGGAASYRAAHRTDRHRQVLVIASAGAQGVP